MTKILKLLFLLVVALLLFSGLSFALDKELPDEAVLNVGPTSYYTYIRVVAVGVVEGIYRGLGTDENGETIWKSRPTWFAQSGSGTVVNDQMVITAAHVITPTTVSTPESGVSVYHSHILKLYHRVILLYDYKEEPTIGLLHWVDEERDVALIRFVPAPKQLIPMKFGWSRSLDELSDGDAISVIVHKRDDDGGLTSNIVARHGHIITAGPMGPSDRVISFLNPFDFTMDVPIIPGDSGSPVIGYQGGAPILIGIARAYWTDGILFYSYAVYVGYDIKRYTTLLY